LNYLDPGAARLRSEALCSAYKGRCSLTAAASLLPRNKRGRSGEFVSTDGSPSPGGWFRYAKSTARSERGGVIRPPATANQPAPLIISAEQMTAEMPPHRPPRTRPKLRFPDVGDSALRTAYDLRRPQTKRSQNGQQPVPVRNAKFPHPGRRRQRYGPRALSTYTSAGSTPTATSPDRRRRRWR